MRVPAAAAVAGGWDAWYVVHQALGYPEEDLPGSGLTAHVSLVISLGVGLPNSPLEKARKYIRYVS